LILYKINLVFILKLNTFAIQFTFFEEHGIVISAYLEWEIQRETY